MFKREKTHRKIDSGLITLRPLTRSDNISVRRFMSCPYIWQNSFVIKSPKIIPHDFATDEYAMRYFEMLMTDQARKTFAILHEGKHIGNVGLKDINKHPYQAECFIEIGEPHERGKGLGLMAMIQLLNYAFTKCELLAVELEVLEFNAPALKVYHRLGFKTTNHNGWHYDEYGQFWRVLRMRLTSSEYQKHPPQGVMNLRPRD